jgi:uncharacterized RDD family membrane protein YckC
MLYESLLLVPVLFLSGLLFLLVLGEPSSAWSKAAFQFWLLAVLGLYFGYCWVKSGQTLAMKTWRIRVERLDGQLMPPRQAALRFVLACWAIALLGLGLLWALFDRDHQFLHDRLAGTRIVRLQKS